MSADLLDLLALQASRPWADPARNIAHSLYCPLAGPCSPECEALA